MNPQQRAEVDACRRSHSQFAQLETIFSLRAGENYDKMQSSVISRANSSPARVFLSTAPRGT